VGRRSNEELEIELVGDIASMVELTLPTKASKEAPSLRRSVKVVAGALNHRELCCKI
jgi:hypothetical protein